MVKIVGIRFRKAGKVYYFDPGEVEVQLDSYAIVETVRGVEAGQVVMVGREVPEDTIVQPLKTVMRIADEEDMKRVNENKVKEGEAFAICRQKISDHNLVMKLIDVEYTFDNNKLLFYFTADGRIDFRELVKDLASVFKTRIELRQIGVRDESKMMGGMGVCGRTICCNSFLSDFQPVSIKMAKEQGLSLNPSKISGSCGRLMCCLKYEQEAYEDLLSNMPKPGAIVETPDGQGLVVEIYILKQTLKVKLDKGNETDFRIYDVASLKVIKDVALEEEVVPEIEALKELED